MLRHAVACALALGAAASAPSGPPAEMREPFPPLHGRDAAALPAAHSPDPLQRSSWDAGVDETLLQVYTVDAAGLPRRVPPNGVLRFDFGVERAAWFEFQLEGHAARPRAAVSEYDYPYTAKTLDAVGYGEGWYRLETNAELFEGARFAWVICGGSNVTVTAARLVAKVRPAAYSGAFRGADEGVERIWYTGAYAARLNMNAKDFGSVLVDRGDRVSIQGDGHPTMAAALSAFASPATWALVRAQLNSTDSGCPGCHVVDDALMPYPVLWTMSCNDYYVSSGDLRFYAAVAPDMKHILDAACVARDARAPPFKHRIRLATFLEDPAVGFMGWDDRLDNGFCGQGSPETQLAFALLLMRATDDFARLLAKEETARELPGAGDWARNYTAAGKSMALKFRSKVPLESLGLHAAANALNVRGLVSAAEASTLVSRLFNDSLTACSWSPFNQYWILQALSNVGLGDSLALANVRLCWGSQLRSANGCFAELWDPAWAEMLEPLAKSLSASRTLRGNRETPQQRASRRERQTGTSE